MPGGYDLAQLPLHLPPHSGESIVSWLRRLSVRYDVPVGELIRSAGSRQPVRSTSRAIARIRNNRVIAVQLGLADDEARTLVLPQPLAAATQIYFDTLHPSNRGRAQSRHCPRCLAGPGPWWPDHWHSPLSIICLTHHCYLVFNCPGCGQPPHAGPGWLTRPNELHRCPSRLPTWHPRRNQNQRNQDRRGQQHVEGSRKVWCDHDLTTTLIQPAPDHEVRAQQRLHDWAPASAEPATACGLAITHRIGFQALAELLDATLSGSASDPFDLYTDPAVLGSGLADALHVLDQPNLDAAAAAAWMLTRDDAHAPTRPDKVGDHAYSPLLAAVQLAGVRHQLTPAAQLTFRAGHPVLRYPVAATTRTRRRLRLPEHHPAWPEPDPAWIPQTLWWNAIPAAVTRQPDRTPGDFRSDSLLAMALARVGSARDWAGITTDLQLPVSYADHIDDFLTELGRSGTWPAVLASLEELMAGVQQHPPPIDYRARRALGSDFDLITRAVEVGRRRHPSPVPRQTLVRQFWERLTGGTIANAPTTIRIDPDEPAYAVFRRLHRADSADLFHVAHRHLLELRVATGPLSWHPDVQRGRHHEKDKFQ